MRTNIRTANHWSTSTYPTQPLKRPSPSICVRPFNTKLSWGLANMFPDHTPSGRTRALTANVFCVIIKCDMVSDSSALASFLNNPMMTNDVSWLHRPITIALTNETTAMTTQYVLLPKDYSTAIAHHFTSASIPRTRKLTQQGLRSQKTFSYRIFGMNRNANHKAWCSAPHNTTKSRW